MVLAIDAPGRTGKGTVFTRPGTNLEAAPGVDGEGAKDKLVIREHLEPLRVPAPGVDVELSLLAQRVADGNRNVTTAIILRLDRKPDLPLVRVLQNRGHPRTLPRIRVVIVMLVNVTPPLTPGGVCLTAALVGPAPLSLNVKSTGTLAVLAVPVFLTALDTALDPLRAEVILVSPPVAKQRPDGLAKVGRNGRNFVSNLSGIAKASLKLENVLENTLW
mmetsp:Transcript_4361/g.12218  ORF Transcript_4361/g.12218 Transcript_4361/m.12218 type:complete len:218 (-) Transcript_4361:447-1100(-)